jgi:hypothetical protein
MAAVMLTTAGCSRFTDGATRLAAQVGGEAEALSSAPGARITVAHRPERIGDTGCAEDYTVQFDKVGALIIWCKEAGTGRVTQSHSTSSHRRHVETAQTFIVNKLRGETLYIDIAREAGAAKPVIVGVR